MMNKSIFDVIIVGGSYAGLSAAMALGRSLRDVVIIDSGLPCNRQTPHSHNFITQDGENPAVIAEKARSQVLNYSNVMLLNDLAVSGEKTGDGFVVTTQSGESLRSKKLIFATGVKDLMPDIKGFSECWGISVIHCPYCHGYEFRGKKTAILANRERAFHLATLVHNLTDDLTLLTSGKPDFEVDKITRLKRNNIEIVEKQVVEMEHVGGNIGKVVFRDGQKSDFNVIYAAVPFEQHSDIPVTLGCQLTEAGHIQVDSVQKTTIPGIYACGDSAGMMRSVAYAVATGNIAGAMVNNELTMENF